MFLNKKISLVGGQAWLVDCFNSSYFATLSHSLGWGAPAGRGIQPLDRRDPEVADGVHHLDQAPATSSVGPKKADLLHIQKRTVPSKMASLGCWRECPNKRAPNFICTCERVSR